MSRVSVNIAANLAGNFWVMVISFVFIPLYIRLIGIEAYGLVGFFATLQAILFLLDLGLSATLNRELARLSAVSDSLSEMRDLVRTLEIIYWIVGMMVGLMVFLAAPWIASKWIKAEHLSIETIRTAIMIMGGILFLRWPYGLYSGGLLGLQRQVLVNGMACFMSTLSALGVLAVLYFISPTIHAFFLWQLLIAFLQTGLAGTLLWNELPHASTPPAFRWSNIQRVWRFAGGMSIIMIEGVILYQIDKIILSRMVSLKLFGYYTLAATVAISLQRLIGPVSTACYPRFVQLIAQNDIGALKTFFHKNCQLVSVLTFPIMAILVFFSYEVLFFWSQDLSTAANTALLLRLLIVGIGLNIMAVVPGVLQGAYGWLSLTIYMNFFLLILGFAPLALFMAIKFGPVGVAAGWMLVNSFYVFLYPYLLYKRILPTEKWTWYIQDIALPLLAAFAMAGLFRSFGKILGYDHIPFFLLVLATGCTFIITGISADEIRTEFSGYLLRMLRKIKA